LFILVVAVGLDFGFAKLTLSRVQRRPRPATFFTFLQLRQTLTLLRQGLTHHTG
jgi:hypothetical protein